MCWIQIQHKINIFSWWSFTYLHTRYVCTFTLTFVHFPHVFSFTFSVFFDIDREIDYKIFKKKMKCSGSSFINYNVAEEKCWMFFL